jgi:hypothetical protein
MRAPPVPLPDRARARLAELTLARDLALDASRTTNQRLQQALSQGDVDPRLRGKLESETSRAVDKHRTLSMLLSRCNQWWTELRLPPAHRLECQPPYNNLGAAPPGETVAESVAKVRDEIADLAAQILSVRGAPLKRESQQEALSIYIDGLVQRAKPRIGFDVKGNARVLWTEDLIASKDDLLGTLAFVFGVETIATAFANAIEQEPEREDAVTPLEREEKLGELSAQVLRLERKEAALLALDDTILPRADMSPLAYLGVRIAVAPPPAQAAAQAVA